eukprot:12886358-Prorocentrum_lima.AAC.1
MKREYAPLPYSRRARDGSHVGPAQALSFSARYLADVQWAPPPADQPTPWEAPMLGEPFNFSLALLEFDIAELRSVIKRFKNNKAAGPDGVRMELYKYMPEDSLGNLLALLNSWWLLETFPDNLTDAQ